MNEILYEMSLRKSRKPNAKFYDYFLRTLDLEFEKYDREKFGTLDDFKLRGLHVVDLNAYDDYALKVHYMKYFWTPVYKIENTVPSSVKHEYNKAQRKAGMLMKKIMQ